MAKLLLLSPKNHKGLSMKITSDVNVSITNKQEQKQRTEQKQTESFDKLLNEKVKKSQLTSSKTSKEKIAQDPASIEFLSLDTQSKSGISMIEDVLMKWEKYSHALASEKAPLKNSYSILQEIKEDMKQLVSKLDFEKAPHLKEIVSELNVLLTTEEIKFNRGDYL